VSTVFGYFAHRPYLDGFAMASVDVMVPCYQYGRFLRESVTSVLRQNIRDLRVLIIDNASTDDTLEVAQSLAAEDNRVAVTAHSSNLGHVASFNEGIDWASSDYFMILCADDLLAPGALARAVSVMQQHPEVNLTYGKGISVSLENLAAVADRANRPATWRIIPGVEFLELRCRHGRCLCAGETVVVRTSAQKQVGYYRAGLLHTCDLEMWLRFACIGAIAESDAVQGLRRNHSTNLAGSVRNVYAWDLEFEEAFESFFRNEGAFHPRATDLHQTVRRVISDRAYWGSIAQLLRGDLKLAWDLWRFAITRRPRTIIAPPVGYLFRREDAFRHIGQVLSEAAMQMLARTNG
jgi:glycosyltransferase involved in cell wall biosynthesis